MRTRQLQTPTSTEKAISAALASALLVLVAVWGGTATFLGLAAGSVTYVWICRRYLESHGRLARSIGIVATAAVAAGVALVASMKLGHW